MQYSLPALHLVLLVFGRSLLASVSDAAGIDLSPSKSLINNGASGSTHELTARDHAGDRQSVANEQRKRRSTEVMAAVASSGLDDTVDGRLKPKWTRNFMRFGRHASAAGVGSHETATGVTCFPISSLRRLQQQLVDLSQPSATESTHLASSSSLLPSSMTSSDIENHKRFMRFGKRFMRFGRLPRPSDLNAQHATALNGNGRVSEDAVYDGLEDYMDDGADSSKRFMRFGKRFMRFGRSSSTSTDDQDELVAEEERRNAIPIDVVCFYSGKDGVSISANKRFMRFGRKFDDSSEKTEAGRPGSTGATLTPGDRDIEAAESAST